MNQKHLDGKELNVQVIAEKFFSCAELQLYHCIELNIENKFFEVTCGHGLEANRRSYLNIEGQVKNTTLQNDSSFGYQK